MLIYEVNLEVKEEAKYSFAGWLPEHIHKVLETKGFQGAHWFFRNASEEGRTDDGTILWTIHYLVENQQSLDEYLSNRAPEVQKEAIDRFGDQFKANRRVLHLLSIAAPTANAE
ncbi:MAG TPA: DUF4286 family protein [Candidatus Obscuribacterales bacterium]